MRRIIPVFCIVLTVLGACSPNPDVHLTEVQRQINRPTNTDSCKAYKAKGAQADYIDYLACEKDYWATVRAEINARKQ